MTPAKLPPHVRQLIVGAGFGGLGMAIKLAESGENDFRVIERGPDVGGTWRDNTYPGVACDVPSQLYSYSFAPNPAWSSSFSPGHEIQSYIRGVADNSGVLDRFVFNTSFDGATWDDAAAVWRIRTSAGEMTANFLINAAGGLVEPKLPEIDGIDTFQGEIFHTARWNHDIDLTGKRVAVVGTGDSGDPQGRQDRRARRCLPAHRAVGHPPQRPEVHRCGEIPLPQGAHCAEGLSGRDLRRPRSARPRLHAAAQDPAARKSYGTAQHSARHFRPGAAEVGHS